MNVISRPTALLRAAAISVGDSGRTGDGVRPVLVSGFGQRSRGDRRNVPDVDRTDPASPIGAKKRFWVAINRLKARKPWKYKFGRRNVKSIPSSRIRRSAEACQRRKRTGEASSAANCDSFTSCCTPAFAAISEKRVC